MVEAGAGGDEAGAVSGGPPYDPAYVRDFYDRYGEREWARLEASPSARVNFHIHLRHLQRYVRAGDRVLEAGAGPGRFTIELARLGARVTVGDLSPGQLDLNRERVAAAGCEHAVVERRVLDIVDLAGCPDAGYDAVVCYGGPLSYLFDRADAALAELLRVVRPGGHVLLSVIGFLGSTRERLRSVLALPAQHGLDAVQRVFDTGDLPERLTHGHRCRMYRWAELERLLARHPCTMVAASAANFLSVGNDEILRSVADDEALWEAFLRWEEDACRQPGALDGGTHLLAVVRRG